MSKEPELCWNVGKPEHGSSPLDCLNCKRLENIPHEKVYDWNTVLGAFVSGYRFAMFETVLYLQKYAPVTEEQKKVIRALGLRMYCAIDRGLGVKDFVPAVNKITLDILNDAE